MGITNRERQKQIDKRMGETKKNHQGYLMKIIKYNNAKNITVEFQDEHKATVMVTYDNFLKGDVKNPYHPIIYNKGIVGSKYSVWVDKKATKEYQTWKSMLQRCFDPKYKEKQPTYNDVTCCNEWLEYENFYEWLHFQPNFDKWYEGKRWAIDKDILFKNNNIYSPKTCCLVPQSINNLFTKSDSTRSKLPIGVHKHYKKYQVFCQNPFTRKQEDLGTYDTELVAFQIYKSYKENIIKQVAEIEYNKGNIIQQCYNAMIEYEVDITD